MSTGRLTAIITGVILIIAAVGYSLRDMVAPFVERSPGSWVIALIVVGAIGFAVWSVLVYRTQRRRRGSQERD